MKKQLLYLSLLFAGAASAQITITMADVAAPGAIILRSTDTAYTATPIGPGGTNMTWNFTNMVADKGNNYNFQNPSMMADAASFPSANLGATVGTSDVYMLNTASSLTVVGQSGSFNGNHAVFQVSPVEKILDFPSTYGSNFVNTSISYTQIAYSQPPIVDSVRVKSTKDKALNFDAWGSLTSPLGTNNVIRSNEYTTTTDSIWIHSPGVPPFTMPGWQFYQENITTKYNFSFWANGQGFPVLEIDSSDVTGQVDVTWNLPSAAGIPTISNGGSYKVYPNPASTSATFDLRGTNVTRVEIYNAIGEVVLSMNVTSDILNMTTEGLSNGLYTARFFDAKQAVKGTTRLFISK